MCASKGGQHYPREVVSQDKPDFSWSIVCIHYSLLKMLLKFNKFFILEIYKKKSDSISNDAVNSIFKNCSDIPNYILLKISG